MRELEGLLQLLPQSCCDFCPKAAELLLHDLLSLYSMTC